MLIPKRTKYRKIQKGRMRGRAKGGTTVSDYLNSRGETGLFQLELQVYGRDEEPCQRCGQLVVRVAQGGRSTFFCPKCQKEK